jgi:hypothetical protein
MKRLKANQHFLHVLKNAKPKLRKSIVKECSDDALKTICEICINILNGNLKISKETGYQLKKYKKLLRSLASPKVKLCAKRKTLVQRGGAILPIILGSLFTSVIKKILE